MKEENIEALKGVSNASKLINDLLSDYFSGGLSKNVEEIKQKVHEIEGDLYQMKQKRRSLVRKLDQINTKKEKIEQKLNKFPQEILKDFEKFPNMNEQVLETRWKVIYNKKGILWKDLLEAYKVFYKKNELE